MRVDACGCVSVHDQTRKHTWEHQAPTPCVGVQDQTPKHTNTKNHVTGCACTRRRGYDSCLPTRRSCSCITAHACRRITPHPSLSLPSHHSPPRRRDAGGSVSCLLAMHTESAPRLPRRCAPRLPHRSAPRFPRRSAPRFPRRSAPRHSCPSYSRWASTCVVYDRVLCVSFFVCIVPCVCGVSLTPQVVSCVHGV